MIDPAFQNHLIHLLDIIGTVIFAITGGVRGVRLKLDLLGVVVFSCTVGVGGGMIRDMLIGHVPVSAFRNEIYLLVCIGTGLVVFFLSPLILRRGRNLIQIFDAFGLGVFTAIGAAKGVEAGLTMPGIVLAGVMTAVGGGVIRDIMSTRIPAVLTSDFYATASLLGGILYLLLLPLGLPFFSMFLLVMIFVTGIRLVAIRYKVRLPVSGGKISYYFYRNRNSRKNQKL